MQTEKLLKLLKENKVKFVIIGATTIPVKTELALSPSLRSRINSAEESRRKAIATDFALGGALILFSDD